MSLKEMAHAVYLGAAVETVMPEGGDIAYWRRQIRTYIARYITKTERIPRKRRSSYRRSGRPCKRSNYAAQVIARAKATAELMDQTNGQKDERTK